MKFTFKNLGPIKSAEMRPGKLTVIAGENNTGKTYLVYALYGFLWMIEDFGDFLFSGEFVGALAQFSERPFGPLGFVKFFHEPPLPPRTASVKVPLSEVEDATNLALGEFAKTFSKKGIDEVFSSRKTFPGFSFDCGGAKIKWPESVEERFLWQDMGFPRGIPKIVNSVKYHREGEHVVFTAEGARYPEAADRIFAVMFTVGSVLGGISKPFILSTERFGISLFYKELDFAKNRLVEMLQSMPDKGKNRIDPPVLMRASSARYAQPIKDNIDYTRGLGETQEKPGRMHQNKLFDGIRDMMEGYYKRDDYETLFISKARKERAFRLPLYLASSSARGMSDFYFYLKHTARPGQMLIVDEPETHLHPVNQIRVARLLARCVNAGLRVLVTTHSDYIVKELNNLIMLSRDFDGKAEFLAKNRKHYDEHDLLHKDDVRAYVCENGGLTPCEIDSRGMIMDSFNDPILEIDRISNELDARLPEEE